MQKEVHNNELYEKYYLIRQYKDKLIIHQQQKCIVANRFVVIFSNSELLD